MSLTIITTTVAILVAIITFGQWLNARNQLKLALFEKRYAVYEKIASYLAVTLQNGRVTVGSDVQFLRDTKRAHFLFSADKAIESFISEVYKKSVSLHCLDQELETTSGQDRKDNLEKQSEITEWFKYSLDNLEVKFDEYIKLKH
jgi:hypothetical protein